MARSARGGATIAIVDAGGMAFVHNDHLATPQLMTDGSAAVVWDASYRPFGEASIAGAAANDQRFPGQTADAETGYSDNWHRTYDPSLGRYLQSDPIGINGGWNTCAYAGGNPVMRVDPTGEFGVVGAVIGGGSDLLLQLSQNGWNLRCVNYWQVGGSALVGAFTGGLGSALGRQGLTSGLKALLSNGTKGAIGEWLSIGKNLLGGSKLVGRHLIPDIPGITTIADSVWRGRDGILYYVESKFGTSGLTAAQRVAQQALGDLYHVERWTYPWLGKIGSGLGETIGGAAGGAAVNAAAGSGCGCK